MNADNFVKQPMRADSARAGPVRSDQFVGVGACCRPEVFLEQTVVLLTLQIEAETLHVPIAVGQTVLQAALAAIDFPHSCRGGSCGTCNYPQREGKVMEMTDFCYVLSERRFRPGFVPACQTRFEKQVRVFIEHFDEISWATESAAGH